MRRTAIGFILRLATATVISLAVWWLIITPFDRLHLPGPAVLVLVRVLNFPVALAGELLDPFRGVQVVFEDHGTWCDLCSADETFHQQMRVAIPTYLFLLYILSFLRWVARRNARPFKRVVIGLLIYTVLTAAFLLLTDDGDRRGDVRIAELWLLILATAAAFAWSRIGPRWKVSAVVAVLLVGAWAFPFMLRSTDPKMDALRPNFVSYVLILTLGVRGTLWLTWAVENGIKWRQRRRVSG